MRNIFKTSYVQDIRLFEHSGHIFWYSLLLLAVFAAPLLLPQFFVGEMSLVFIYAVAGIGLMILTGFTGLASLGHAAFLGIGAYAHVFLVKQGIPFPFAMILGGFISAAVGIALRCRRSG
jgi:branched-chain amino acid transport system permease protein